MGSQVIVNKNITRRDFLKKGAVATLVGIGAFIDRRNFDKVTISKVWAESRNRKPTMRYRMLGRTNMMVSEISFGGALNYGKSPWLDNFPKILRNILDRSLELGINLFDTSSSCDHGYCTEDDFAHLAPNRNRCFISTKIDKLSALGARSNVENSLRKMKLDYIDLVLLHNSPGSRGNWDDCLKAFDELDKMKLEGKIRFMGISNHNNDRLKEGLVNYRSRIDAIMMRYSFHSFYSDSSAEEVINLAKSKDVGVIVMKAFMGANEHWNTRVRSWQKDPTNWSRLSCFINDETSVAQACIKYVLNNPGVSTALLGMRNSAELEENIAVFKLKRG